VYSAAVEGILRQAPEVAHARQHHVAQAVEKFVHVFAAQSHRAAMGMPLRILKFAMDFFARVITAFCPVSGRAPPPRCPAAWRSGWLAEADVDVIFFSFGTAIMFFQPKRFISAGTVSLRYFSCNRLFIAFFYLVLYLDLSNAVLQWRQLRTFVPSGKIVWPIRVCLPQLPQTTSTFETLIPASFSTIPPLMFFPGWDACAA